MKNTNTFRQYIWLINILQRNKSLTLKRIQQLWIDDDLNDRHP